MGFTIEFGNEHSDRWSKTPSKDWRVGYTPHPDENPSEDFRITTDKLEEFGKAIDKFETESRMIEYHWKPWINEYSHEVNTFPLRENGRWVKYGSVTWKDMRIELEWNKQMEADKRKRARQKKKEEQIQKLKDQIKKLGG